MQILNPMNNKIFKDAVTEVNSHLVTMGFNK